MKDVLQIYHNLFHELGDPTTYWPQWCATEKTIIEREKIIIGMILVQRTSWHNANIALKNLKENDLLSINKIASLKNLDQLTQLIRPAGFYQSKPQRLFDVCHFFAAQKDIFSTQKEDLLALKGVGPETADTILLYALDQPVFIIDEYTRRFVVRHHLTSETNYLQLQKYFENNLTKDVSLFQNFHALIIISQRGPDKSRMEVV